MKANLFSLFCLLCCLLTASAQTPFRVVGYMPSWAGSVSTVQYSKLTHINYAFLLPTATGGLQAIENPSKLQSLVSTAHANNVKVLISVGGWNDGNDSGFEGLAANATYRTNFVNNMVNFVNQYNLDGVDIDWEYPDAGASANNYISLMTQLSTAMHNQGKLLTGALVGTGGASILSSAFALVDFYTLMAYDYNNFDHSTYTYATQSVNYWLGRGMPASKLVLGLPFYGRPTWESYAQLLARGASPNADVFDNVGYNGIPTIKAKTNLAFDQGSGVMIWELSQDATGANSLLSAINDVVVARSGGGSNPAPIGKVITLRGNNNLYVSGENGTTAMTCNRATYGSWEQFSVLDGGNGKIALRSMAKYVSSENGTQPMTANRTTAQDWEKFTWVANSNGTISLRASNNLYVSSENGAAPMNANRTTAGGWESFNYTVVGNVVGSVIAQTTGLADNTSAVTLSAMSADIGDKTTATKFSAYPNPVAAGGNIFVKVPAYNSKSPVKAVLLSAGRQALVQQQETSGSFTVKAANVPAGTYFLEVSHNGKVYTQKIIIQ
ncbi:Por secretion system C-terminal sorting domain-containing protein [Chitinophaga jiangningensis]|uniref:chitinase n=1 Tax=Chitinophaga jiangningensis TaxID=1419482 RepID=A0A1M7CNR2_9BACT|nr:glycosyl hydrolase family 18 protein [Chitinophaga jiangningensis]SHL68845.1 Por secretion system C-terminal sorting domain-containing protein [Chitinophaga jiangningensis]